jgi:hypothetical protein
VHGKKHQHYALTLANMGLVYKAMGDAAKGLLQGFACYNFAYDDKLLVKVWRK